MHNAIIVPFGCIGIDDSVKIILDSDEVLKSPFLRDKAIRDIKRAGTARAGVEEELVMPIGVPKPPSRCYFLFSEPYDTKNLDIYNKTQAKEVYNDIKRKVEQSVEDLLVFRGNINYYFYFYCYYYYYYYSNYSTQVVRIRTVNYRCYHINRSSYPQSIFLCTSPHAQNRIPIRTFFQELVTSFLQGKRLQRAL